MPFPSYSYCNFHCFCFTLLRFKLYVFMSIFRSIKIQQTVCFTNQLLLVKPYKVQTCQLQFPFAEVFLECDIQQEYKTQTAQYWPSTGKDIYLVFCCFMNRKWQIIYCIHAMACFFIILSWKGFQCCETKNKKDFQFIKFRRILRPSKAPRHLKGTLESLRILKRGGVLMGRLLHW